MDMFPSAATIKSKRLELKDIILVRLYLKNMKDFSSINSAYVTTFKHCLPARYVTYCYMKGKLPECLIPGISLVISFNPHSRLMLWCPWLWNLFVIMFSPIGIVVVLFFKFMWFSCFLAWFIITGFFYFPLLFTNSYYFLTTVVSNSQMEIHIHGKA